MWIVIQFMQSKGGNRVNLLCFHVLSRLPDLLRDVFDLHDRVWLDNPQQVLFKQCIEQRRQMHPNRRVPRELIVVFPKRLLKVSEVAVLVCACKSAHAVDLAKLGVFGGSLHGEEGCHVFGLSERYSGQRDLVLRRGEDIQGST